tara:strand:+ start:67615 stop:68349 length:735 start_codon:yes stop_codon:yes gene_type:complete
MSKKYPFFSPMGDKAILIEFGPEISEITLQKVLICKKHIEIIRSKEIVEVINTYCSLLITYVCTIENVYNEFLALKSLISEADIGKNINSKLYHIPVCYEEEFGLDLYLLASQNKLSISEIIDLHTSPIYTVCFIGFLPGFLYLGGLDKKLIISRRSTPRMKVEKGAVGIGENQTGIYPKSSPGGWQIIGNSPVNFFDKKELPPCQILAGDKVKFYSVKKQEYLAIIDEMDNSNFQLKSENYVG